MIRLELYHQLETFLTQEQEFVQTLSSAQRQMRNHWQSRLEGPNGWKAMLSSQYRLGHKKITRAEAQKNDQKFGNFVDKYLRWEVEDHRRERAYSSQPLVTKLVNIGVGTGLGLKYCKDAVESNMKIEVYDWLRSTLKTAQRVLQPVIQEFGLAEEKVFHLGEAVQVVKDLDDSVGMFVAIRLDEHLTDEEAALFFQNAGKILLNPLNRIVIAGARQGEINDQIEVETCRHRPENFPLRQIEAAIGKTPYVYRSAKYQDVEKVIDFVTLRLTL